MKTRHLLPLAIVALAGLSLGAGCPTVPKLEDRVVELALGSSTTVEIPAAGVINVYDDTGVENLATDIDLNNILGGAGVNVSDVKDIKLAGISYRVTVPDPTAGRSIDNSTVTARRGAGVETQLITNFSQSVSGASSWTKAPLSPAGVTLINGLLTDILVAKKGGVPVVNPTLVYHVVGTSNPQGVTTNFTWQIRLDLTIVGTIKVKVLN